MGFVIHCISQKTMNTIVICETDLYRFSDMFNKVKTGLKVIVTCGICDISQKINKKKICIDYSDKFNKSNWSKSHCYTWHLRYITENLRKRAVYI